MCFLEDNIGPPSRKEIITSKPSITVTYGQYKEVGSINNKGSNRSTEASFSHSAINSRKFNPGSEISVNTLGGEVKSSIGGELSWNKKEIISVKKTIPANKAGHLYVRDKISTAIFRHKIQIQKLISGKWKYMGPSKTSISKVITTTPDIKFEIKDN